MSFHFTTVTDTKNERRWCIHLINLFQRTFLGIAGERLTRRVRGMLFKSILRQVSKDAVIIFTSRSPRFKMLLNYLDIKIR